MSSPKHHLTYALFLLTVFLSAFMLFQVQPLISKFILPWFGGGPAVWTTCMLFFQVVLFGGYLYAHLLVEKLLPRNQAIVHTIVVLSACVLLPIAPDVAWKPALGSDPTGRIIALLAMTVGLPYFALSTTGPLLQGWFARTLPGTSPYRLYALSNVGSLLALISYPFVFEPNFDVERQVQFWTLGFVTFAVLCALCAWRGSLASAAEITPVAGLSSDNAPSPQGLTVLLWIALAAVPSALLLGVTNQVCTDIAVVPFLWVVPLALYLLSFILCFDSDRWYSRGLFGTGLFVFAAAACFLMWDSAMYWNMIASIIFQAAIYFGLLMCGCMVCHGELVALKPAPRHLTRFYLCVSAGGALGGLCVGMLAPLVFRTLFELPLAILLACTLLIVVIRRDATSPTQTPRLGPTIALGSFVVVLGALLVLQAERVTQGAVATARNFYGVLRVHQSSSAYVLRHGQIRHGHQFTDPARRRIATTYFGEHSGGGVAIAQHRADQPKRVGIVGLGAGTLAVYAQSHDYYRMYEINPAVVEMAKEYFTYLSECRTKDQHIVVGDGRIALEQEEPQDFDVLALDAFSGDAIPAHLLTRECCELYLKHLKADGILACHITNRHVDLRPVCNGLANEFGLSAMCVLSPAQKDVGGTDSIWVLLSRDPKSLQALKLTKSHEVAMGDRSILWTDAFSNLLSVLNTQGLVYERVSAGKPKLAAMSVK